MLKSLPICQQFVAVQFDPRLDQSSLPQGQVSADHFRRVNAVNRTFSLIQRMKMRQVMAFAALYIHPNQESIKPGDFGHNHSTRNYPAGCTMLFHATLLRMTARRLRLAGKNALSRSMTESSRGGINALFCASSSEA